MAVNILEHIWVLFIGVFSWAINRLMAKIDDLEKNKANNSSLGRVADHARALDKRIDELAHTALPRSEIQRSHEKLHERLNVMERNKADKIRNIRTHQAKEKGDTTNGQ